MILKAYRIETKHDQKIKKIARKVSNKTKRKENKNKVVLYAIDKLDEAEAIRELSNEKLIK